MSRRNTGILSPSPRPEVRPPQPSQKATLRAGKVACFATPGLNHTRVSRLQSPPPPSRCCSSEDERAAADIIIEGSNDLSDIRSARYPPRLSDHTLVQRSDVDDGVLRSTTSTIGSTSENNKCNGNKSHVLSRQASNNMSFELFDIYDCNSTVGLLMGNDTAPFPRIVCGDGNPMNPKQTRIVEGSMGSLPSVVRQQSALQACLGTVHGSRSAQEACPETVDGGDPDCADHTADIEWNFLLSSSGIAAGLDNRMHSLRIQPSPTLTIARPHPAQASRSKRKLNDDLSATRRRPSSSPIPMQRRTLPLALPPDADVQALDMEIMRSAGVIQPRQLVSFGQRSSMRPVQYTCSLCDETYQRMTSDNAWWSVQCEQCPICFETQYPYIDIDEPLNAMELDPNAAVVYSEGSANVGQEAITAMLGLEGGSFRRTPAIQNCTVHDHSDAMTPTSNIIASLDAETGQWFDGATSRTLRSKDAAQLLQLMRHARQCRAQHVQSQAQEACTNIKLVMLHVRDCPGCAPRDHDGTRPCPRSWCRCIESRSAIFYTNIFNCRPIKALMHHLVHCADTATCPVCSPNDCPKDVSSVRA